ncbi:MAG: transaldolase [Alphaproteobacteria bacterium]|nr:transaldolase [Alphaproteobacteria bacterium]
MNIPSDLRIKIFADGANLEEILRLAKDPMIKGFTTNPTLMRKAGIEDYETFARDVLAEIVDRPVSFEVFADDLDGMVAQGFEIAGWGPNVNVKIPVTNTQGESTVPVVERLVAEGVVVNVTAVFTLDQVRAITAALDASVPAIVSVFAGRIADTGRDPIPHMREAVEILRDRPKAELIWASPRELLNVFHADESGCHIITVTNDILAKLANAGKSLETFSLETVKMFHEDAAGAGYEIQTDPGKLKLVR